MLPTRPGAQSRSPRAVIKHSRLMRSLNPLVVVHGDTVACTLFVRRYRQAEAASTYDATTGREGIWSADTYALKQWT
jgi:hypothetical protein